MMTPVEDLRSKAIGYVWALEDSGNDIVWRIRRRFSEVYETVDLSMLFSQAYAEHVESGSYLSIQDAWYSWSTFGLIFWCFSEEYPRPYHNGRIWP